MITQEQYDHIKKNGFNPNICAECLEIDKVLRSLIGKAEIHKEMYEALKELIEAEWMVSHDWGGDRGAILNKASKALAKVEVK